jgi:hypothetical protein
MRTLGIVRAAARAPQRDLLPRLRAGIALPHAHERVQLELPAFTWPWRIAALAAVSVPFVVPDPLRFLAASGLL